jgi:Holliday junction resolvase RusA-like endonuclease
VTKVFTKAELFSLVPPEARGLIQRQLDPPPPAAPAAPKPTDPGKRYKVSLWVDGVPKGQPRAKAFHRGDYVGVYDPATAEGWKSQVADAFRFHRPATPILGPVSVRLKKDPPGPIWHTAKPDRDNCEKAVLDALKVLRIFKDDAQVCTGGPTEKYYCAVDGKPGLAITVEELP